MEKYFEIKPDSELYKEYFAHQKSMPKIVGAFDKVCEKFGIEATSVRARKDTFWIVPTKKDREKFSSIMKKNNDGEFKKNSEPNKMWRKLVKDIENFQKPQLIFYFKIHGIRWSERLFHIDDKLYGSVESDGLIDIPEFCTEMKASQFYKIIEENEKGEQ